MKEPIDPWKALYESALEKFETAAKLNGAQAHGAFPVISFYDLTIAMRIEYNAMVMSEKPAPPPQNQRNE